jgi:putative endonuclease
MYYVYLLLCGDGTLYCGITNDLEKRIHAHNHLPTGAKYTRGRRPVTLMWSEEHPGKSEALVREYEVKKLTKAEKRVLAKME